MTIAQQLKIKEFPFIIKDSKGKEIYFENSEGYWSKCEWDSKGNTIHTLTNMDIGQSGNTIPRVIGFTTRTPMEQSMIIAPKQKSKKPSNS